MTIYLFSIYNNSHKLSGDYVEKIFHWTIHWFFLLAFLMLVYISQDWNNIFFEFLYESMYTPIVLGLLGMISAFLGMKGTRVILIFSNFLILIVFGIAYFVSIFGFKEP